MSNSGKILGIDYGEKNIGVALSDKDKGIAFPKAIFVYSQALKGIQNILKAEEIDCVVIGKPLSLKGDATFQSRKVEEFKEKLKALFPDLEIVSRDERWSSQAVIKNFQHLGYSEKEIRLKKDMYEAAFILQGYLDEKTKKC